MVLGVSIATMVWLGFSSIVASTGVQKSWPNERAALVDLASATRIEHWVRRRGWLDPGRSVCDWDLVGCNGDGRVKLLTLSFNNLTGTLPETIGMLEMLEDLDLEYNKLIGTIPDAVGGMAQLIQLGLGGNQFNGRA